MLIMRGFLLLLIVTSILSCSEDCSIDDGPDGCKFDPEVAMIQCKAAIPSFYYDRKLNSCVAYSYGGCNDTPYEPFSSLAACEACLCNK